MLLNFKKGLLANLPSAITPGTVYITSDERGMYVDLDANTRIRIGDFQEFATLNALKANTNPSTTALYYITDINCLAKWTGTEYIQINTDTGATSVEVVGEGNAVTAASYDPATRKLTLTKGETFATPADVESAIEEKVGDLTIGDVTHETVKAYVDAKTANTVNDGDFAGVQADLAQAQEDIVALDEKIGTLPAPAEGEEQKTVAELIEDAKAAAEGAQATADGAQGEVDVLEGVVAGIEERLADVEKDYLTEADKTELQGNIDLKANAADVYTKAETYTQQEVLAQIQAAIAATGHASFVVAESDPTAEGFTAEENVLYLYKADGAEYYDIYAKVGTEVVWLDNFSADFSDYSTTEEMEAAIAEAVKDLATKAEVQAVADRVTELEKTDHSHENADVLNGITADKVSAWDGAAEKAHEHENEAVLNGITADKVTAWDGAQAAAEATAAAALEAAKTELNKTITDEADAAQAAAEATAAANLASTKSELEGSIATKASTDDLNTAKTTLQGAIDLKADASALDTAKTELNTAIGLKADASALEQAKTDLSGEIDAVEASIGDVAEGSTVVGMIAENASAIEELSETLEWGSF